MCATPRIPIVGTKWGRVHRADASSAVKVAKVKEYVANMRQTIQKSSQAQLEIAQQQQDVLCSLLCCVSSCLLLCCIVIVDSCCVV